MSDDELVLILLTLFKLSHNASSVGYSLEGEDHL